MTWGRRAVTTAHSTYRKYTSATNEERKQMHQHWENALLTRVFCEPGARERHAEAQAREARAERHAESTRSTSQNGEPWPPPGHVVVQLEELVERARDEQQSYIVDRLVRAERRIRYAPDFGGEFIMVHLHQGEAFLSEAQYLLEKLNMMTPALKMRIEELRDLCVKHKFDYDLT